MQRTGFWRARGRIEGLQESPSFMTTRPSHNIINGFLKLTNKNSAAICNWGKPWAKEISSLTCKHVNQTMSRTAPDDYCRVCKCCFKQQFGNFSKIVHVSSQNLFKPSQRKQSFGIVLSDLCDKFGLPLKNSEYHSNQNLQHMLKKNSKSA